MIWFLTRAKKDSFTEHITCLKIVSFCLKYLKQSIFNDLPLNKIFVGYLLTQ